MVHTSPYVLPNDPPVIDVDCLEAFTSLSARERLYAHHLSRAAWDGGLIVLLQTSPESPLIHSALHRIFIEETISELRKNALENGILPKKDFQAILAYTAGIIANNGNYRGYGNTKFIPAIPRDRFLDFVMNTKAFKNNPKHISKLWNEVSEAMYSLKENEKTLGFDGVTTYCLGNCTVEDANLLNDFLQQKRLEAYNTRAVKTVKDGIIHYQIRLASVMTDNGVALQEEEYKGAKFSIGHGDYSPLLKSINESLLKAWEYAANEREKQMISCYVQSFTSGSILDHKEGSRHWVANKGPVIETYLGFIETYRDPAGTRGEFEGFVAMVNKKMSAKFTELVNKAEQFLPRLPWPREFEREKFIRPDFTSLDVLCFSGSGIPSGINIPNYDEVRLNEGFKNVSLGNIIPASFKGSELGFLSEADQELLGKYRICAFELQVGLHELLGHGSGKKLRRDEAGLFNFDIDNLLHPITNEKIKSWYEPGETQDSKFMEMASTYEECRAECVGLYLSLEKDILKIFGFEGQEAEDVMYANWLSLVWTGMSRALEMYRPETKSWLQAHSQARFVIMNVLVEAEEDLVKISQSEEKYLLLTLDRTKIETVGKEAIRKFLLKLQVYLSTGDVKAMKEMYSRYSEVSDEGKYPWASWREIVMANLLPRRMFVQPNTFIRDDDVYLKTYDASVEGIIESWVDRFPSAEVDDVLEELYWKDINYY